MRENSLVPFVSVPDLLKVLRKRGVLAKDGSKGLAGFVVCYLYFCLYFVVGFFMSFVVERGSGGI